MVLWVSPRLEPFLLTASENSPALNLYPVPSGQMPAQPSAQLIHPCRISRRCRLTVLPPLPLQPVQSCPCMNGLYIQKGNMTLLFQGCDENASILHPSKLSSAP